MITSMARGKTLEEAMKITNADVAEAWGACRPTSCTAPTWGRRLHSAIKNYKDRKSGKVKPLSLEIDKEPHVKGAMPASAIAPTAKPRWTM